MDTNEQIRKEFAQQKAAQLFEAEAQAMAEYVNAPTPASYGEPWGPGQLIGHIVRTDGTFVGELNNVEDEIRVRACVNACQGIADPVEAIREAKEALRQTLHSFECGDVWVTRDTIESALAKLNNTAP